MESKNKKHGIWALLGFFRLSADYFWTPFALLFSFILSPLLERAQIESKGVQRTQKEREVWLKECKRSAKECSGVKKESGRTAMESKGIPKKSENAKGLRKEPARRSPQGV